MVKKISSNSGFSQIILVVGSAILLLASLIFVGWAIYDSQRDRELPPVDTVADIDKGEDDASLPPPDPPPDRSYYCPLDGTEFSNRDDTERRPVMVQIDNAPAARPQSGLSRADVVYEAMAEGEVTRYSAIFGCRDAEVVGPVRSARLINLELVPEYQALLANSGASDGVNGALDADPDIPNISQPRYPGSYWRTYDRAAPHDMMTSTELIREAAEAAGYETSVSLAGQPFKKGTVSTGAITSISVSYSTWADVSYRLDTGSNSWLRFIGGAADIDALTDEQISPSNVIIQYVDSYESDILEDAANYGLIFELTGSGAALVFRDGEVVNATWERPSASSETSYFDSRGRQIQLNRGLTWIQLVPTGFTAASWS